MASRSKLLSLTLLSLIQVALIAAVPSAAHAIVDTDGDGVENSSDNCVLEWNPPFDGVTQLDADVDGIGNACDADFDNDGLVVPYDFGVLIACLGQFVPGNGPEESFSCAEPDLNGDGVVDAIDSALFNAHLSTSDVPGPSGLACGQPGVFTPCEAGQVPDRNFNPRLETPRYTPSTAPIVAVDRTHDNFHTIDHGYLGFARLLRADGYVVQDFAVPFTAGSGAYLQELSEIDTLVIVNAQTAISAEEASVIAGWLSGLLGCASGCNPRSLLLIGDHGDAFNFPLRIAALTNELSLVWLNGKTRPIQMSYTETPDPEKPNGFLHATHPIARGANSAEAVEWVQAPHGSALWGPLTPSGGESLLTMPPNSEVIIDRGLEENPRYVVLNGAGWSQGTAFSYGSGRVYVSAEAAMFTAQTKDRKLIGMNKLPRNWNVQYLLNLMHWLDGAL